MHICVFNLYKWYSAIDFFFFFFTQHSKKVPLMVENFDHINVERIVQQNPMFSLSCINSY